MWRPATQMRLRRDVTAVFICLVAALPTGLCRSLHASPLPKRMRTSRLSRQLLEASDLAANGQVGTDTCSSVFIPAVATTDTVGTRSNGTPREQWQLIWRTFIDTCNLMESQVELAAARFDFTSVGDILQEIRRPSTEYTILLPPKKDLILLRDAQRSMDIRPIDVLDSLLLHVVQNRHTRDQLEELAVSGLNRASKESRGSLTTLRGEELRLRMIPTTSGPDILEVAFSNVTTDFKAAQEFESCRNGSTIIEISNLLSVGRLASALESWSTTQHALQFQQGLYADGVVINTQDRQAPAVLMFLIPVAALIFVLFVVSMLKNRRRTVMTRERAAQEVTVATEAPPRPDPPKPPEIPAAPVAAPPKVLYRIGGQRWSTSPPEEAEPEPVEVATEVWQSVESLGELSQVLSNHCSMQDLQNDMQDLQNDSACVICYEREGDHVLLPCGHSGYCGACAHTLLTMKHRKRLCPLCRSALTSISKINLKTPIGAKTTVIRSTVGKPYVDTKRARQESGSSRSRGRDGAGTGAGGGLRRGAQDRDVGASRHERRALRAARAMHAASPGVQRQ